MYISEDAFKSLSLWVEDIEKKADKMFAKVSGLDPNTPREKVWEHFVNDATTVWQANYPDGSSVNGGPLGEPGRTGDPEGDKRMLEISACYKLRDKVVYVCECMEAIRYLLDVLKNEPEATPPTKAQIKEWEAMGIQYGHPDPPGLGGACGEPGNGLDYTSSNNQIE